MNFFDFMNNLHLDSEVITEKGSHGIRYFNGVLQVFINGKWIDASAKAEVIDVEISKEDFDAILESGEVLEGVDYHIMGVQGSSVATVSNPNLLINPDFRINQRNGKVVLTGKTAYTDPECTNVVGTTTKPIKITKLTSSYGKYTGEDGNSYYVKPEDVANGYCSGYSVDRWIISSWQYNNGAVKVTEDGIELTGSIYLCHFFEKYFDTDKSYSLSIKADGKVYTFDNAEVNTNYQCGDTISVAYSNDHYGKPAVSVSVLNGTSVIEWVKLEEGSVATPFISPGPATELLKCQRYYEKIESNCYMLEQNVIDRLFRVTAPFKVTKRVTPTVNILSALNEGGYTIFSNPTRDNACFTMDNTEATYPTGITCFEADAEIY